MEKYTLKYSSGQSIEQLVTVGHYDYTNGHITSENFPAPTHIAPEIFLMHIGYPLSGDDAVTKLKSLGMYPATLVELLIFGATYPELQLSYPVVALGSSWVDPTIGRRAPYLRAWYGERDLALHEWSSSWRSGFRFIATAQKGT